jgi:hypothetical protein
MALVCNGRTGDVYSDSETILDEPIQDNDSLGTLLRIPMNTARNASGR